MKKLPVAILGATGMVGQKFLELLQDHPWFEIQELGASINNEKKKLKDVPNLKNKHLLSSNILNIELKVCEPNFSSPLIFSALDSTVAYEIEEKFRNAGYTVISNASAHRMSDFVPLIIPEVNPEHLSLVSFQENGQIITNPNCSTIGLCLALKPLIDLFDVDQVHVTTMQAISGAGYPGVASLDILDNVIPFISNEEEKLENEPLKIFGTLHEKNIFPRSLKISAQCNRVAVQDGHTACISLSLKKQSSIDQIIKAWNDYQGLPQKLNLPSAPKKPVIYLEDPSYPQPKLHRSLENGMAVSIGRLRKCPILDYKFTILSHNTIRGAAGSTILIGELLYSLNKVIKRF